jgi:hypothetical protein
VLKSVWNLIGAMDGCRASRESVNDFYAATLCKVQAVCVGPIWLAKMEEILLSSDIFRVIRMENPDVKSGAFEARG